MQSVKESVIQSFIQENYPNAKLISWDDPESRLQFYTADQLQEVEVDWFPLCCRKEEESQQVLYGGRSGIIHTYTEGETGAGKTSRFAMQTIRALSCLKNKPSFLVVDIHGELAENLYTHLQKNGYDIKILNCDDPDHSDSYNPFAPLVKRCLESGTIDNEVIKGIRKIAEIVQPVVTKDDPIWEQGARSYTNGCILDKFEDLLQENIPPQCITLYNIIENHYWLRDHLVSQRGGLMTIDHYREKGANTLSVQKMMSVTDNAEKTRASYFGVIENHYDAFGQPSLYQLSSHSTIDIDRFIDTPTVIFIQSGSTKIGDDLIAMLVNEIYTTAVIRGKNTARKMLPRKVHCFLDEFANSNIADGPEFIKMLTTSRKFGMYWHLLLQCDAQLDSKFDADTARIIRANCTEIFMGSNEYETMVRFARSCGQKTVESLGSLITQEVPTLETVDLITADKLNLTEYGHVYIKSNRHSLLHSYFEAFYNCPEFVPVEDIRSVYPVNNYNYKTTAFFPDGTLPPLSGLASRVLLYLYPKLKAKISALEKQFAGYDLDGALNELLKHELINENDDEDSVRVEISDRQYALLLLRQKKYNNWDTEVKPIPKKSAVQKEKERKSKKVTASGYFAMQSDLAKTLGQLTSLSDEFVELLCKKAEGGGLNADDEARISAPTVRFELIESFIMRNFFAEKEGWNQAFQKEHDIAMSIPQIPKPVKSAFAAALKEIVNELTLQNILEVKRIISS